MSLLVWALIFLVVGLIAGAIGLTNVSRVASWIAKVLFIIFIVTFLILIVLTLL